MQQRVLTGRSPTPASPDHAAAAYLRSDNTSNLFAHVADENA